jgi:hypothetical protein
MWRRQKSFFCALPEMAEELPEVREMDLNPVKLLSPGDGAVVVDCRMLVKAAPVR